MPPLITGFSSLIRLSSSEQLGKMPDMFPTLPTSASLNKPKSLGQILDVICDCICTGQALMANKPGEDAESGAALV